MPDPITQAGFSDAQKLAAISLRNRIQAGENIPLEELRQFILASELDLRENRLKPIRAEKPKPAPTREKPTDVDFF